MASYSIKKVQPADAKAAYAFHQRISHDDPYVWQRTEQELEAQIAKGYVYCALDAQTGSMVGLCYTVFDAHALAWEIGGMTIDSTVQRIGLATALGVFAMAHLIVYQDPWNNNQRVLAHVHKDNPKPRALLEKAGFVKTRSVTIPDAYAPPKMRREKNGEVHGDEFEISPGGLLKLSSWFDDISRNNFKPVAATVTFLVEGETVDQMAEKLRKLAGG